MRIASVTNYKPTQSYTFRQPVYSDAPLLHHTPVKFGASRRVLLGVPFTALALLLSACGGSGTPSNPETTEPGTVTATTTQPATYAQILQNLIHPGENFPFSNPCRSENLEQIKKDILSLADALDRAQLILELISNWDQFCSESEDEGLEKTVNELISDGLYNVLDEDGRPKYEELGRDIIELLFRRLALAIDAGDDPDSAWKAFYDDVAKLFAKIDALRGNKGSETKTSESTETTVSTLA